MTKIIAFNLDQNQTWCKAGYKIKYSFFLCHGNQDLRTLELKEILEAHQPSPHPVLFLVENRLRNLSIDNPSASPHTFPKIS